LYLKGSSRYSFAVPQPPSHSLQRSVEYISGYLGLGMVKQAREELAKIPSSDRSAPAARDAELAILYAGEAWRELERVARSYTKTDPGQIQGWLSLAFAKRRTDGVAAAKEILLGLDSRFGGANAILHFNLACYHCLLGETEKSIMRLRTALQMDANLHAIAAEDEDLKPLWPMIAELR
jgi:hypothetical protein